MGHLVNARSFRLGWNMIGPDIWYKPHYDYASFIFLCARQRAVLRMLFYSKVMDKSPYIFSHFEMEKVCRHFFIKIYFYFIPFEGLMERLYRGVWKTMRRWKRKFYRYPRSHMSGMFISDRYRNWWNKKNININIGDLRRQKKKMFYYLLKYLKRARLKRRKLIFFKRNLYDVMDKPKSDNVFEDSTYLAFSRNNELLYKNLLPNYNKVVNKKASSLARIGDFHFYDKLEKREMPRCIWLFFEKGHTDISIISRVKLNLEPKLTYGNDVAWTLLKILNARERKIDSIVDDVKRPTNKFSFSCWEFVDALLENFYDTMRLNRVQRNIRKFKFNIKDLILALLVGIKHQSLIFKVWHSRQRSWYKKLDRRTKVYINRIYFDNWKTFKLERRILNKYNMMSFKKSKKKKCI